MKLFSGKRAVMVFLAVAAVMLLPLTAQATMEPVPLTGGTATNTITNLAGVEATGSWNPDSSLGFTITSTVTQFVVNGSFVYEYDYSANVPAKNFSHIIIGVSKPEAGETFFFWQGTVSDHTTPLTPLQYPLNDNANNTPGLPAAGIYGISFPQTSTTATFSFFSYNAPVWQDFYAKDGTDAHIDVTAWNTGFGLAADIPFASNYIIGPDSVNGTVPPVPVPPSVLLLGSGLVGLGLIGWRRREKKA
jgi:hypothetical protein